VYLAAFEAHLHFEVALERVVTELLQNDTLIELGIYPQPTVDDNSQHNEQTAHTPNFSCVMVSGELFKADVSYDFVDWNFTGNPEESFSHLMAIMTKARADVYIADYSHLGVNCCRIIVPSWSEIYPIETLIESNNNVALELRETFLALPNVDWEGEQYAEMYGILEEEGYDDSVLLAEIIGLAPQVGDAWQTLRIGEVKCLLALAGGDLELALELATWCLEVNATTYSPERIQFFHCLVASLNLALDEESDPAQAKADFELQYGVETVAAAWGSIEGTVRFYGVTGGDLTMSQYPSHLQLLSSYQKLHIGQ
jgi:ribosomal protein S12 methylthiotransferase accessory factor